MSEIRHLHEARNARETRADMPSPDEINSGRLFAFVERIERLNEEKKALSEDIGKVFAEAKAVGYDPKVLRKVVSIRAQDPDSRAEEETILDLYLAALGVR